MIKRKFGMACLNITQGRFNNFSHKNLNAYDLAGMDSGIDRFRTFNDLEVIGIHEYSKTGFANTICFYDKENDVTLAFTHMNNISSEYKVGKVFTSGETVYYEGTKGNATGNHIHLEIGQGKQANKVKINGIWQLKSLINIEDYFYIDSSYTTVRDDGGYDWKTVSSIEHEGSEMEFIEGYQEIDFKGVKAHVYKLKDGQKLGLMSAIVPDKENWQAVATINNIDNDKIHYCKINANRFVMATGEHIGVEQSFENDFAPKQNAFIALWQAKDGSFGFTDADEYWDTKDNVNFACSPDVVLMKDNEVVKYVAKGVESTRLTQRTQQSLLIVLKEGSVMLAVTEAITLNDVVDVLKDVAKDIYAFDGGGSAQMIVNGLKKQYTGRAISCVLTAYTDPGQTDEPTPDPDPTPEEPSQEEIEKLKAENAELIKMNEELHDRIDTAVAVLNGSLVIEKEESGE